MHKLPIVVLERVVKVGQLRILPRHVHDQRHQDALAHARLAEQLPGNPTAEPERDVHELLVELLVHMGCLDAVLRVLRRRNQVQAPLQPKLVPRRRAEPVDRVRHARVPDARANERADVAADPPTNGEPVAVPDAEADASTDGKTDR